MVADKNTPIPGGTGNFGSLGDPSLDGGQIAFTGRDVPGYSRGLYMAAGSVVSVIADQSTPVPGGTGNFGLFGDPSLDGGNVAFEGRDAGGYQIGLFVRYDGVLLQVVGLGDMLDGKTIRLLSMGQEALSGNQLAFRAIFSDDSQGIFIATIPEPSTGLLLSMGCALLGFTRRRHC